MKGVSMPNGNIIAVLFLLIAIAIVVMTFGAGGGWALYLGWTDNKKAVISKNWPSVPGTIVSSRINEVTVRDSDGLRSSLQLDAEYEYSVDSVRYINNRYTPGHIPKGIPPRKAAEVTDRFAVGNIVPVYYNPGNPQESCLERDAPLSNLAIIIGIVLLALCFCQVCVFGTLLFRAINFMITG